ncbi:post-GPI attachment to proteins factor 6-like isoform X2 [Odontomachus brunneus]|uniref:post-GPI attachment to proteins factor 6-like isoform X2 n=1 Tax=Odontomachus brunneus TaxID=486640 RepID=UPI0013F26170|nr:post-GPI attachment to proteins factor 6-like isoform X2 [Odontomachus brunneus]
MISTCLSRKYLTLYEFYIFLSILLILFQANHCATPHASQEDVLHSFKSYSDVAMFHYTVPKDVLRATWQFAAFMDDPSCQSRKVHIHLRFGSYPVISTSKESFFINTHIENNHEIIVTTMTIYQPTIINTTIVPIYGPEAGDWFVAAYMSPWDQRVQQQGLGHKCQYSIGTVALWSQVDSTVNIPIGCEIMSQTSAMITHYKIYIPSGTWDFRVSIWNCNFTVQNMSGLCIKNMSLKGRSLPISNNSHLEKPISLTTGASHTFVESNPYEDSYYYLSIVSSSIIKFNIKVDVTECPIKITEKFFNRRYINTVTSFNSIMGSNTKYSIRQMQYYKENNNIDKNTSHKNQFFERDEKYNTDMCIPRHQLARVKHTEAFSAVYFLQGDEWLSSRLMLTDSVPIMTQFNILQFIDIGGTLDINAYLEAEKLTSKRLVVVTMCVQRGRIPKLGEYSLCQNGTLSMNLSSLDKHNASLLIAYPQSDTYYILINTVCYNNNNPVYCELEDISVLLNVRTKKCVFSDPSPCGDHGVCREIQKGNLYYTTCSCFDGYAGYGCTDIISTTAIISSIVSSIMLILSNAFFIPAIYLAVKRELYAEGLVYFATMLCSSFYHACDQNDAFCITKYEALQYSDFFSSILAFWVTLVAMAKLTSKFVSICHMTGVFLITLLVQINKMYLFSTLIPLLMGILIYVVMHTYRNIRTGKWKKPRGKMIIGLLLAIIGVLLYSFIETEGNYGYVHSVWHITISMSLIFLLPSKRFILSRNISPNNNNEPQNYKEHDNTPTFTLIDLDN